MTPRSARRACMHVNRDPAALSYRRYRSQPGSRAAPGAAPPSRWTKWWLRHRGRRSGRCGPARITTAFVGLFSAAWVVPSDAALPSDPAGMPFVTFAHARAAGDYALACEQIAPATLTTGIIPPTLGAGRKACASTLSAQDEDLDDEHRLSLASTRVVKVQVKPGRARVTVQATLYGIQPRSTGTAVIEHGQWKISELPSGAHVGSSFLQLIPSSSMQPTLLAGDTVLVDHAAYRHQKPRIGDIVVFHPPVGAEGIGRCAKRPPPGQACAVATRRNSQVNFVKRIVAGPGDRVSIRRGRVTRNGVRAREEFITPCGPTGLDCDLPRAFAVAKGRYYVLGDDRGASADSRVWGPVARSAIVGRVSRLSRP